MGTRGRGADERPADPDALEYLKTIQIPREDCSEEEADDPLCESGHLPAEEQQAIDDRANQLVEEGTYDSYGEALFNMDLASGAYSCARCHTNGYSYGDPGVPGQGAFGWNLTGGSENTRFPNESDQVEFVQTGSEQGVGYAPQAQGTGRMPGFGNDAHRPADPGHRRIRTGTELMGRFATLASSLLAINWEPEIRGLLITVIAVALFCGSIYLLLATNLGARLGFLVALTGLMGWMTLMGIMWMIYGIGLKGPDPSWKAVPGRTVLQDTDALFQAGVFEARVDVPHDAVSRRRLTSSRRSSNGRAGPN